MMQLSADGPTLHWWGSDIVRRLPHLHFTRTCPSQPLISPVYFGRWLTPTKTSIVSWLHTIPCRKLICLKSDFRRYSVSRHPSGFSPRNSSWPITPATVTDADAGWPLPHFHLRSFSEIWPEPPHDDGDEAKLFGTRSVLLVQLVVLHLECLPLWLCLRIIIFLSLRTCRWTAHYQNMCIASHDDSKQLDMSSITYSAQTTFCLTFVHLFQEKNTKLKWWNS